MPGTCSNTGWAHGATVPQSLIFQASTRKGAHDGELLFLLLASWWWGREKGTQGGSYEELEDEL